jgi:AraC family ethanolamine operon transcriptional activator
MIHQVFSEYEAYQEAHKDVDIQLTLSHPERSQWSLRHLLVDSLHIQSGSDGCGDVAEGTTRQDGWILYFQTSGQRGLANGEQLTRDSVAVAGPGAEFCLTSQGCHDWTSIFFPSESLIARCGIDPSSSPRLLQVVSPGQELVERMEQTTNGFMEAATADDSLTNEAAIVYSFCEEMYRIAERIFGNANPTEQAEDRSLNRHQLVRQAIELIEEWPHMSPTVSELARKLNVSERTLRSIFVEYLGISPHRYLVAKRLNHARRLLLMSDPDEITVRQAAAKVGFWDFGRFAKKHRRLFGELPSETLQRKYPPS